MRAKGYPRQPRSPPRKPIARDHRRQCNAAMKRVTAFAVLLVVLAAPAWAGWDEGVAAYDRGDYAAALREWRPFAEQGNASAQFNLGVTACLARIALARASIFAASVSRLVPRRRSA